MVFSSIAFLFYFLPLVFILYFGFKPIWWKNFVLMTMSLVFYLWGAGSMLFLLLVLVLVNWFFVLWVDWAARRQSPRVKAACAAVAVCANVGMLAYFKYANFFVAQCNQVLQALWPGFRPWPDPGILLPIGISFFTFHGISYVVDIANGKAKALRNPVDFTTYMVMFPQLIAGPIIRYFQIADQLRERTHTWEGFCQGMVRFCHGLVKKVVIADSVALIADQAFGLGAGLTPGLAWLGALAYTLQIYFDFSGYSDMAIGLGRMFGFKYPENFNRPLSAVSITDFWRRWHMSLSAWFRDYVYIPLGGSRVSTWKTYRNLFSIFILVGLWHGASWNFVLFGVFHGFWMVVERLTQQRFEQDMAFPVLHRAFTLGLVILGFVVFRSPDLPHAWHYYRALFGASAVAAPALTWFEVLNAQSVGALAIGCLTLLWPASWVTGKILDEGKSRLADGLRLAVSTAGLAAVLLLIVSGTFTSFIYFRF